MWPARALRYLRAPTYFRGDPNIPAHAEPIFEETEVDLSEANEEYRRALARFKFLGPGSARARARDAAFGNEVVGFGAWTPVRRFARFRLFGRKIP